MDMMIVASPEAKFTIMVTKETPRYDAKEVYRTHCFSYELITKIWELTEQYKINTCSIYGPHTFIEYFAEKIEDKLGIKVKRIGVE